MLRNKEKNSELYLPMRHSINRQRNYHNKVLPNLCNTELFVVVVWILNLIFFEHIYFHMKVSQCEWPDEVENFYPDKATKQHFEDSTNNSTIIRIALIGDPQLTDRYSYSWLSSRNPISYALTPIVEFYCDLFMRKSFHLLQIYHQPRAIFILGDLFDSGRSISDEEYENEYNRFEWVFETFPQPISSSDHLKAKKSHQYATPRFYLSGNHDIGYDIDKNEQEKLAKRFVDHFGPLNYEVFIDEVSFVVVAATLLEQNTTNEKIYKETESFLQLYNQTNITPAKTNNKPIEIFNGISKMHISPIEGYTPRSRILFHHTPLYRPPDEYCGDDRIRSPSIKDRVGYSYRNMLQQPISKRLIELFKPLLTFSGDDHDYCTIKHTNSTTEHTIGTFNFLQGNKYPSFAMVSITSSHSYPSITKLNICFTPSQLYIYFWYITLTLFTIIFLLFDPLNPRRQVISLRSLQSATSKEKLRIFLFRLKAVVSRITYHAVILVTFYFFLIWISM